MGDLAKIKLKKIDDAATIPVRATNGSSGYDLFALEAVEIPIRESRLIRTGISLEIPYGYEGQIRSRSGLAIKEGIFVLNSPGTIDSDYRGELMVVLYNLGMNNYKISVGDKIAQLIFQRIELPNLEPVDLLSETERGSGGFGSTDKKKRAKKENVEGLAEGISKS